MSPSSDADQLLRAVGRLHRWATRHVEHDLPHAQLRLLTLVDDLGPSRIGDLAAADHCSQPTMSAQVQRLERDGLLERSADPADQRASLLDITSEGRAQLERARTQRAAALSRLLHRDQDDDRAGGQIDPARLTAAIATLEDLLDAASTQD